MDVPLEMLYCVGHLNNRNSKCSTCIPNKYNPQCSDFVPITDFEEPVRIYEVRTEERKGCPRPPRPGINLFDNQPQEVQGRLWS